MNDSEVRMIMLEYGDFDSILCVINQNIKPFKKKNLHYLLTQYQDIVDFRDISGINKCPRCRQARPWFIIKNVARGIFVIQKVVEFFEPWCSHYLQKPMSLEEISQNDSVKTLYVLITQQKDSSSSLHAFYARIREEIVDEDIRLKNGCVNSQNECNKNNLWMILKKNDRVLNILKNYESELMPWCIIKGQIPLFKEMIPEKIIGVVQWTRKMERELGHLKVQMDS